MLSKFGNSLNKEYVLKKLEGLRASFGTPDQRKNLRVFLLTSLAVLIGLGISAAFRASTEKMKAIVPSAPAPRPGEVAKQVILKNLDWADVQAAAGLEPHLMAVKEFFATARQRTRGYSEAVLGWDSKWKLASDYVTGRQEHAEFLQNQFESRLFSTDELNQLIQQTVSAFLRHTQDIEGQMLVRMMADLEQLPAESLPNFVDESAIYATLSGALQQAANAAQSELGAAVGLEVISYVTGEVLTMVAANLATSAGILTAGAGSSWATFGVGIVVSIIADALIQEIYQQQVNPIGKLTGVLNRQLDEMESLILAGTNDSPGLKARLNDYTRRRSIARRQAIQSAILAL